MHPLHDYVAKQLAEKLKSHKVVVWYDARSELVPFVGELRGAPRTGREPVEVSVQGIRAHLVEYAGSMFEVRALVEPLFRGDEPGAMIVYVAGRERDRAGSVLMELEVAGTPWEPSLKHFGRNVLLQKYTQGHVDELLPFDRKVTYEDLARAASRAPGSEPPSILKSLFHDAAGTDALLSAWLVSDARDEEIVSKEATAELVKLVRSRLGLELAGDATLAKMRAVTLRYVLAGEFRSDLDCPPPGCLDGVPVPPTKDSLAGVRDLASRLRAGFPNAYSEIADRLEGELGLTKATLPAAALGAIDTFRFEEKALLAHAGKLISGGKFADAQRIVSERQHSFWLDRDVARKAHWEACRRMADLGNAAAEVLVEIGTFREKSADEWIAAYTRLRPDGQHATPGWYRLDLAQRRLEAWVANLIEEPEEQPLGVVRRAYEDACQAMAEGFTKALAKAAWSTSGSLHQTRIFSEVVSERPKPVAYFLVDAMRFEMGVELAERLPKTAEVSVRHAVGSLPSITPVGMAALQPGASSSFSVVEDSGTARIDDVLLPDLAARRKHAAARVPGLVDMDLDSVLSSRGSEFAKRVQKATVVVVRSTEIDRAGETWSAQHARQIMENVVDNIVRAAHRLARAGVDHAVITSDHGHLFGRERDESMRIPSSTLGTGKLHRRCWVGRGGETPPGCVRVSASALGYTSDLDFVFPVGCGVFTAGGDLAFHHGGPSLQEMILPVVTLRLPRRASGSGRKDLPVQISGAPTAITNRIVTCEVSSLLGATIVPLLLSGDKKAGGLFGIHGQGAADRVAGTVQIPSGGTVTVAMLLTDDTVTSVTLVMQDPVTDAELYRSANDIPVRLGV